MAQKRMFSLSVVDTDWFLDLPLSTQALYFHLNMRADDDGFVDAPNSIIRKVGASKNDFDLLVAKRFILQFESGIIVIKHWRMHNTLRRDRYNPTQFQEEYRSLLVKENGAYTDNQKSLINSVGIQNGNQMATNGKPNGTSDIDLGLGLDLGKDNNILGQKTCVDVVDREALFNKFWEEYPKKVGKEKCKNWFLNKTRKVNQELLDQILEGLRKWKSNIQWQKDNGQYIPNPYTWLNRGGWNDIPYQEEFKSQTQTPIIWDEAK